MRDGQGRSTAPIIDGKKYIKWGIGTIIGLVIIVTGFKSAYTVPEGHICIIKNFGKAVRAESPGLHFKVPYVEVGENIDVRTRKNVETMSVATKREMPAQAIVSVNWTVKKSAVLDMYIKYGGLNQFETRILDPKFKEATKNGIAKYTAEENINIREQVKDRIAEALRTKVSTYPIDIDDVNYEDIKLPKKYLESINEKQAAKNLKDAQEYKLETQNLVAQQEVNIANADRDGAMARADGEAYKITAEAKAQAASIRLKGEAEASAIKAKGKALRNNPLIVQLTHEQTWDGKYPTWMTGDTAKMLMNVGKP